MLSAVDPEVCNDIIADGILGALRDTTRVLVTHAMHVLPRADLVIVVEAGRIAAVGKYADLVAQGFDLLNHVAISSHGVASVEGGGAAETLSPMSAQRAEATQAAASAAEEAVRAEKEAGQSYGKNKAQRAADKLDGTGAAGGAAVGDDGEGGGAGAFKLVGDEDRKVGVVSAGVWVRLLLAAGWWLTIPVVLLYWGGSILQQGSSAWLKIWVEDSVAPFLHTEYYYIGVFAALSLTVVFIIFIRTLTKTFASARLSLTVHTSALTSVFNAPMSWFEATKVGRLINRFSSDLGKLDWSVLDNVMGFVWMLSSAVAMLLLVILYSWYSLIIFGPLLVLYYFMQRM